MENYDKNIESSFLIYADANNLYGWAMMQTLPVGNLWIEKDELLKFNEEFINAYDVDSDIGYTLEIDIEYPVNLHKLHSDMPFLPERTTINNFSKLVNTLYDKKLCYPQKCFKTSIKS